MFDAAIGFGVRLDDVLLLGALLAALFLIRPPKAGRALALGFGCMLLGRLWHIAFFSYKGDYPLDMDSADPWLALGIYGGQGIGLLFLIAGLRSVLRPLDAADFAASDRAPAAAAASDGAAADPPLSGWRKPPPPPVAPTVVDDDNWGAGGK